MASQSGGINIDGGSSCRILKVAVFSGDKNFHNAAYKSLDPFYLSVAYDNGEGAVERMLADPPSAIVVDIKLQPRGGLDLIHRFRVNDDLKDVPLLVISDSKNSKSMEEARSAPADDHQSRPLLKSKFLKSVSDLVNRSVEKSWDKLPPLQAMVLKETVSVFKNSFHSVQDGEPLPVADIEKSCEPMIEAVSNNQFGGILRGVRDHDDYTYVHSLRVSIHLALLGHAMGIRGDDLKTLSVGGLVHDIGKSLVPHNILNKPDRLSDQEWPKMKAHVLHSRKILERTSDISNGVKIIALQHHEKIDGSGYPLGIKGNELNDLARMASIIDIYGALSDRRSYKPAFPVEKSLAILLEMKDELDQGMVKLFREILLDAAKQEE